jgi:hypothetical protein
MVGREGAERDARRGTHGRRNANRPVVSQGTYVMSSTPIPRITRKGKAERKTSTIGLSKRYDARNRLRPTGGVRYPSSRLAMR